MILRTGTVRGIVFPAHSCPGTYRGKESAFVHPISPVFVVVCSMPDVGSTRDFDRMTSDIIML
jgi:hypothetical protein